MFVGNSLSGSVNRRAIEARASYLASRDEFARIAREVMTSAPVVGSYIAVFAFNYVFIVVEPYENMLDPVRTLTFLLWAAFIWAVPYFWLGPVAHFAAARNLPYFWTVLAVMAAGNVALALITHLYVVPGSEITHMLSQIGKITGFQAATLAFLTIHLRSRFAARLSTRPELIPWFRPTKDAEVPLLMELPEEIRGEILRMESMNQYVRVTTEKGAGLVRMSLARACEQLPDDAGWRIHRSHWIAKSEARSIVFEGGNPRLVARDGERLPMSRQATAVVKDHISRRDG